MSSLNMHLALGMCEAFQRTPESQVFLITLISQRNSLSGFSSQALDGLLHILTVDSCLRHLQVIWPVLHFF